MRYLSIIFGFVLLGCDSGKFPDTIKSELSEKHYRVKGTKLFVKDIEEFKYIPDINIFKNSDSVYIHCLYTEVNFQHDFDNQKFDFFHNKNYQIILNKTFTLNGLNGVYYKLKEGKSYWLYFIFGDSYVENRIVATFPIDNLFEKKVFDFVKSVYYQPDFKLNPLESAKFDFDPLSSRFEFISFSMNSFIYMQKPRDLGVQPNNLFFSQLPPINDTILLKQTLDKVIENIKIGINIKNIVIDNTFKVDSCFAYSATITGDFENRNFYNRTIITSNNMIGFLFGISLYNEIDDNIAIADSVLKTVKIKTGANMR